MTTVVVATWIYISGAWVDVSADVLLPFSAEWGLDGNGPLDRVASTGEMHFDLRNTTKKYSPDNAAALAGWGKGLAVKSVFTFDGDEYIRFRGAIDDIQIDPGTKGPRRVHVTCLDWMEYAAQHPIVNPGILTNQTGDGVLTQLLKLMPINPQLIKFDTGINTFPTTFDTVTSTTKAVQEFNKVAFSEIGYVYLQKGKGNGETLVFENAYNRHGLRTLSAIPKMSSASGALLKEDGGYILKEDGGKILLNELDTAGVTLNNSMMAAAVEYGHNVINRFTVQALPRKLDASPVALFNLNEPIVINSREQYILKGTYANPDGGLPINAQNMITPVATTDYLFNSASDGTGTNLTSYLTVTSIVYGTEGFTAHLNNTGTSAGYLTRFSPRGTGIYIYNPITHEENNYDSQNLYGLQSETLTQKYENSTVIGRMYTDQVVDDEARPRTVLNSVAMCANTSDVLMLGLLNLDVGNVVRITENQTGVDGYYVIQGVSYQVLEGDIVMFQWEVKQILTLALGLSMLGIEFGGTGTVDAVNFGYVPSVSNLGKRSVSAWIYLDTAADTRDVVDWGSQTLFYLHADRSLWYYQAHNALLGGTFGIWHTPAASVPTAVWVHIVFTLNTVGNVAADPIIYINGTAQTLTETSTPSGPLSTEEGLSLVIGNKYSFDSAYLVPFDGQIKDVRIYNRILTAAEVTAIYNSGTPSSTTGAQDMVFQAFAVPTSRLAQYINVVLGYPHPQTVRDAIHGVIGHIHGAPIGRTP